MAIPARPVAGAILDAAWGQGVHDQVYTPAGTVANSAVITVGLVVVQLPLTVGGPNLNGGDFLAPVDGTYLAHGRYVLSPVGGMANMKPSIQVDGVDIPGTPFFSSTGSVNGGGAERTATRRLTAGQRIRFAVTGGTGTSGAGVQVYAEIARLGDTLS